MNIDDLNMFTSSLKEKLGDEAYATISDDLGTLITKNNEVQESLSNKDNEISKLKDTNEKLVSANGSLLQQVPMGKEQSRTIEQEEKKSFSFKDVFDEKGRFKK